MKSVEAFLRELQPHVDHASQKICVAFQELTRKPCDEARVTYLLRQAASGAFVTLMNAQGRRQERLGRFQRGVAGAILQALLELGAPCMSVAARRRLQSAITDEVNGYFGAIRLLWEADRQENDNEA